ncbi:hypothetical protein ACFFX0_29090 [Citricoccus parietis]|uniref:Uncharacterized protein n=1 Tax=Citricoccus parietis TaxID=592307 RepID=A0ABV5G813_9MICC
MQDGSQCGFLPAGLPGLQDPQAHPVHRTQDHEHQPGDHIHRRHGSHRDRQCPQYPGRGGPEHRPDHLHGHEDQQEGDHGQHHHVEHPGVLDRGGRLTVHVHHDRAPDDGHPPLTGHGPGRERVPDEGPGRRGEPQDAIAQERLHRFHQVHGCSFPRCRSVRLRRTPGCRWPRRSDRRGSR